MDLADLSWTDVEAHDFDVALLPTGSTEQHGPHAPLRTDALIAERIAGAAMEETSALRLPTVPVGVSEEHRGFAGTLYVSPSTFRSYVSDVLRSAADHGVRKAVVVNGHGGNVEALQEVCSRLTRDDELFATEWTWWRGLDDVGHAGEVETSVVLHLEPGLVSDDREEGVDSWGSYVSGASVAYDSSEFTRNGVVGDPREASAEKGEELFDTAVEELVGLVEWIRDNKK